MQSIIITFDSYKEEPKEINWKLEKLRVNYPRNKIKMLRVTEDFVLLDET